MRPSIVQTNQPTITLCFHEILQRRLHCKRLLFVKLFKFAARGTPYYRLERYNPEKGQWTTILERVATFDVQDKFMHASIYKTDKPMSPVSTLEYILF